MTAPALHDPFEREHLLFEGLPLLKFNARAFELPLPELLRWLGIDLAAGVPRDLGGVRERLLRDDGGRREDTLATQFYQVGPALAVTTEIEDAHGDRGREHRVVELIGVKGDLRVRINATRARARALAGADVVPAPVPAEEPAFGQVRVWGGEPGMAVRARASIARHLKILGVEIEAAAAGFPDPLWAPPAADRAALDPLIAEDSTIVNALVDLLRAHPADAASAKPARRVASDEDRVRRPDGSAVLYRYELTRVGTGVVHSRRREVLAGTERPGLVRTFYGIGLKGGGRVRIRDVGGRGVVEAAGTPDMVAAALSFLDRRFAAKPKGA